MTLKERLNKAMQVRKLTQEQLAKAAGMAQSSVWKLTSGDAKSTRKLLEIAEALEVSPEWLGKGIGDMDFATKKDDDDIEYVGKLKSGFVKVKGDALMGFDGNFEMLEGLSGFLRFYSDDPNAFGLKVRGDSMFPRINAGEFVVIEPIIPPSPGDEVLVRTCDGKNMIKKLEFHRDGTYRFASINQNHSPITLGEEEVSHVYFVSAIIKSSRYIDVNEL